MKKVAQSVKVRTTLGIEHLVTKEIRTTEGTPHHLDEQEIGGHTNSL